PRPLPSGKARLRPSDTTSASKEGREVMALLALLLVTAIWGVTFVQVKDAVEIYPLFAFLAVRFAIASVALAPFSAGRFRGFDRRGLVAGVCLGGRLAPGYALQTAGLSRTTGFRPGFTTRRCVVAPPTP